MDEESLKRNTDCVYFLASPFTCKKGLECEYRHSEMARLNPRDCWYWSSGNCLNPTCGYRHPPMDTHNETSAKPEPFPNTSALPPNKNNVPCYYFFNGWCDKGDKCGFLHGYEDTSAVKPKIDSALTDAPLDTKIPSKASVTKITAEQLDAEAQHSTMLDTKILDRMTDSKTCLITESVPDDPSEKGPGLREVALKTCDNQSLHPKKQIQAPDTYIAVEQKTLRHGLVSEFEEGPVFKSASVNLHENIVKSDVSIYSDDQSSEDLVARDVVRDEWWESSPGFDVLVEGRSEGMTYEDEQAYMHAYNEDHDSLLLDHHYEDRNDSSERFLHDNRMREPSYYSDDDERYDVNGYIHRDRGNNHMMSRKRKFGGHYGGDLREHLSKRRFHENREDFFRHCIFPFHTEERREEPIPRLHGRLASKLERNGVSLMKEKPAFVVPNQRGQARNSELLARHHHHHERKRPQFSSRGERKPFSRQKREIDSNISFTGPKTLAQIKEEKDRAREDVSSSRHSGQNTFVGFEGPKPLTEILKDKKRGSLVIGEEDISNSS